jgi:hypothetical protein
MRGLERLEAVGGIDETVFIVPVAGYLGCEGGTGHALSVSGETPCLVFKYEYSNYGT